MNAEGHLLICGITRSGKSTLARLLARNYRAADRGVMVCDPLRAPDWPADFLTDNPAAFLDAVKQSWACGLFIDEAGEVIGRHNTELFWLARRSRHRGHRAHFITQRATDLAKTVRDQCTRLCVFAVSPKDADTLAHDWNCPEIEKAPGLARGQFLDVRPFHAAVLRKVF